MEGRMRAGLGHAGWLAGAVFLLAVVGFGAVLQGYSQTLMPVALLGARGFPHASWFNLLAFVVPGALAVVVAIILRRALPAGTGWMARIGTQLMLLSALAFIAMGLLPLDTGDLESEATRLHGTAWMLWAIAFVAGASLLALGLLARRADATFGWFCMMVAAGVSLAGFVPTEAVPAGLAQRIAFGLWFAWLALAGRVALRGPSGG